MAAPEGVRVPTGLDDPPRFLFFDADLVAVVLTVTYLGAVLDHIGAGVFLGALSAYGWHKVSGLHGAATAQRSPTGTSARLPSGGRPRARPDTSCAEARPPTVRSERQSLPPHSPGPQPYVRACAAASGILLMLYTSIVAERIGLRRSFAVIMAMSFALNFILALALLLQQPETRTIVVPPTLAAEREVWTFDEAGPGAPYLERWALSVLSHAASVTPETVDSSRRVVLQHVDPGFYGKLEEALIVEADRIKKDHSSTIFYPDRARVNTSDLSVEVEGVQKTLVGSTVTSSRKKTWRLTFRYDAGRLFLTSLTDQPSSRS